MIIRILKYMIKEFATNLLLTLAAVFLFLNTAGAQSLTPADTATVRFINDRKFFIHKVEKGETLYSISQKYKIPQDEILELNPNSKSGLKPKTSLWIPAFSWKNKEKSSAVVMDKVEAKKVDIKSLHIALISKMDLSKVYLGNLSAEDSIQEPIDKISMDNLEFIEGAQLAIEDFHKRYPTFKIRTSILDSEGDSNHISKLSWKAELRKADVWITNETGTTLDYVNRLAVKSGVQLISCGINTSERIENNDNAISMLPSSLLQCREMGAYAAKHFKNSTGIFVKTSNTREIERMMAFKEGWQSTDEGTSCRVADYSKGFSKAVLDSLRGSKHHVIFIPSSNEDLVTTLLIALKDKKASVDFTVIGLPKWYGFETVHPQLMQDCEVYLFNSGSVDLKPEYALDFRKKFREEYMMEPNESAYIAFDAATIALNGWKKDGANFLQKQNDSLEGVFTDYHFQRMNKSGCFENRNILVWTFKDLRPILVK